MKNNYPHKTKRFLRDAKEKLELMATTNDIDKLKRSFAGFLEATKFSLHQLKTEHTGRLEGFDDWWSEKAKFLDNDILSNFFAKKVRNDVIKKGKELLGINFEIGEATLNGPLQIGWDGVLKLTDKDGKKEWLPMDVPSLKITHWDIRNKPEELNTMNGIGMCRAYFEVLDNITNDFVEKFCK